MVTGFNRAERANRAERVIQLWEGEGAVSPPQGVPGSSHEKKLIFASSRSYLEATLGKSKILFFTLLQLLFSPLFSDELNMVSLLGFVTSPSVKYSRCFTFSVTFT